MNTDMMPMKPINPWVGMLTRPRETVRYILETDPRRQMHTLAIAGGVAAQVVSYMVTPSGFGGSLILQAALGVVSGLVGLYLGGAVYGWAGRLMGGRGTAQEVRAALAWSQVPVLWAMLLVIIGAVVREALRLNDSSGLVTMGVLVVSQVWVFVTQLKAIGEAHDFSAWRALVMMIIISVVLMMVIFGVGMALLSLLDSPIMTPDLYYSV